MKKFLCAGNALQIFPAVMCQDKDIYGQATGRYGKSH